MIFEGLPLGQRFGAILCDVPWDFQVWSPKGRGRSASRHYRTLTDAELQALPMRELAAPDCVLFLWTSGPFLERSLALMAAWRFLFKTIGFVWLKADGLQLWPEPSYGTGYWTRSNAELVLIGVRGRPARVRRDIGQVIVSPRRIHSRKPDEVQDRIERLVSGPYLELFARRSRPNWVCWGDQAQKFDEAAQ